MASEKDYSNPKKLGFMRLLEVLWIINICCTMMSLFMLHKGHWNLDFIAWRDLFNIVLESITLWLLWERKKVARYAIIAFAAFTIVVGSSYNIIVGGFDPLSLLFNSAFDIILILYFWLSPRAKAVLVQPFSKEIFEAKEKENARLFEWKTWPFWRNIIIFYCVFSVVGHWMEAGFCLLVKYGLFPGVYDPTSQIWSDFLYPFPVYGVGFCVCVLLFHPIKQWLVNKFNGNLIIPLVLTFVIATIVCGGIELALGLATNMPSEPGGKLPLWDYSDMPFNFMGQICLLYSSAFGVAATAVTWLVYPPLAKLLNRIPREGMNLMFTAILAGYALLLALYMINLDMPEQIQERIDAAQPVSNITYTEVSDDGTIEVYTLDNPSQELIDSVKESIEAQEAAKGLPDKTS